MCTCCSWLCPPTHKTVWRLHSIGNSAEIGFFVDDIMSSLSTNEEEICDIARRLLAKSMANVEKVVWRSCNFFGDECRRVIIFCRLTSATLLSTWLASFGATFSFDSTMTVVSVMNDGSRCIIEVVVLGDIAMMCDLCRRAFKTRDAYSLASMPGVACAMILAINSCDASRGSWMPELKKSTNFESGKSLNRGKVFPTYLFG